MYPGMAKDARDEGFDDIAEWFETLAKAEKSHAGRFQKVLDSSLKLSGDAAAAGRVPAASSSRGWPADAPPQSTSGSTDRERPAKSRSQAPTAPPAHDPNDARYWDERDLEARAQARLQICHDCRMCVSYCGSFPICSSASIATSSTSGAEGAETLDAEDFEAVVDHCWQCKLCYIKCPYTPDEGASELLDFPRLMAREKAQRAQRDGITLVDRVLGEPQARRAHGGGRHAPLANLVNENRLLRKVQREGDSASRRVPAAAVRAAAVRDLAREARAARRARASAGEVVLFATCYGDYNFPQRAARAVRVLEQNGFAVRACRRARRAAACQPRRRRRRRRAATKAQHNVALLLPARRAGMPIVVPGPTCGYTMKKEWPELLGTPEAKQVAAATFDVMEFLEQLRREKKLERDFKTPLGKVAYHAACHLRAQKIGTPGARVLGARARHRGRRRRAVLGRRRHLGHEGAALRDRPQVRAEAGARDRGRRAEARRHRLPALRAAHPARRTA